MGVFLRNDQRTSDIVQMTFRRAMTFVGMAFLWTASQIPLYFYGGAENQILEHIGGVRIDVWIALGNLIPLAIVTPFVGALSVSARSQIYNVEDRIADY